MRRAVCEAFDVFLIIPYKIQTCCHPSLFKTLKTFSGAECLQDKVQAPKCGFIICLALLRLQPSPPTASPFCHLIPLEGSVLLLALSRSPCPKPRCVLELLAGEAGASPAPCHGRAA